MSDAWLGRPPQPRPAARVRLFCFPHAGGTASAYFEWGRRLPEDVELWALQPPGRATRLHEPPLRALLPLAQGAATALAPLLDRPYALFGHSMGAWVAFEAARALRRRGERPPLALIASSAQAPHLPRRRSLAGLCDAELLQSLARLGGTPPEVLAHPELMALVLPPYRADLAALEDYACQPDAPLDCPIEAFAGETDVVAPAALAAWAVHTRSGFRARLFPGGHFYLKVRRDAVLGALVETLRRSLAADAPLD